jgi:hypothetical protein
MKHPSQQDRQTSGPSDISGYGPSPVRSNGRVKDSPSESIRTFYNPKRVGITGPPSPVNTPLMPNEVSCSSSLIDFARGVVTARS